MSSLPSALFAYPKQAEFGRTLPKNKIYEHSGANTRLKVRRVLAIAFALYLVFRRTLGFPRSPFGCSATYHRC